MDLVDEEEKQNKCPINCNIVSASFVASKTLMNLHLRMCTYLIYMMCIQIQYGWYMVYESIQKTNGCFNVSKP